MMTLYLDESGDHSLVKIDPQYPVFVLGGVIVDAAYGSAVLEPRLRDFKRELFDRDDLILHTADIARNRNGFESLVDSTFRARFYERLNALMRELDYRA